MTTRRRNINGDDAANKTTMNKREKHEGEQENEKKKTRTNRKHPITMSFSLVPPRDIFWVRFKTTFCARNTSLSLSKYCFFALAILLFRPQNIASPPCRKMLENTPRESLHGGHASAKVMPRLWSYFEEIQNDAKKVLYNMWTWEGRIHCYLATSICWEITALKCQVSIHCQ